MASQEAIQTITTTTACLIEYDVNTWSDLHRIFTFVVEKHLLPKFHAKNGISIIWLNKQYSAKE